MDRGRMIRIGVKKYRGGGRRKIRGVERRRRGGDDFGIDGALWGRGGGPGVVKCGGTGFRINGWHLGWRRGW